MEIAFVLLVIAIIFVVQAVKVVPQQSALVVERLGKYHATLTPGLTFLLPFIDRVAYKHSLKESPAGRAQPDLHHAGQHAAARWTASCISR
jgi:regulator of protease activity HflC (stomatin/prohibitin superfamily)